MISFIFPVVKFTVPPRKREYLSGNVSQHVPCPTSTLHPRLVFLTPDASKLLIMIRVEYFSQQEKRKRNFLQGRRKIKSCAGIISGIWIE